MSPNPGDSLAHLRSHGYHSRSNRHSNALAESIVADLVRHCPSIRRHGESGELVYDLNFTLRAGTADWNVDLVLGLPEISDRPPSSQQTLRRATPVAVRIGIELKSVMTEHRKAVKNRKRDLEAHHEHVHNYDNQAIAGGVLIINASPTFESPLRAKPSTHRNPAAIVEHCIRELRSVATRGGATGYGLEAKCAIIVEMDNVELPDTRYSTAPPAPQPGDPLHYDAFIRAICDQYTRRFG